MQDLGAGKRKKEKVLLQAKGDEDITSMDTTSPIHWSWS
jgi:hypothetical protein